MSEEGWREDGGHETHEGFVGLEDEWVDVALPGCFALDGDGEGTECDAAYDGGEPTAGSTDVVSRVSHLVPHIH